MKRIIATIIVLVLCLSAISLAFAGTVRFYFSGQSSSYTRSSKDTLSVGTTWKMKDWVTLDVATNRYPQVRIFHAPGTYASSHFNYKTQSEKPHAYKEEYYDGETVYVGCKKLGSQNADVTADATFDP